MKKKAVAFCLLGAMALGTCTVSAANGTRNISATFRNIKIVVDGKELSTSAEPFIYNGTTYLPIRAVGEAVGKEVTWNGSTNTVYLGEVPAGAQQTPAPETPAAGATGEFPMIMKWASEVGESEKASVILASGNRSDIEELCMNVCIYFIAGEDDVQSAKAAYDELAKAFGFDLDFMEYCQQLGLL